MTIDGLKVVCVQVQLDQPAASFLDGKVGGGGVWLGYPELKNSRTPLNKMQM